MCDNGNEKIFQNDQLSEAKAYCASKAECAGVAKHSNGLYTPRCGVMITHANIHLMYWMNKNGCITGINNN